MKLDRGYFIMNRIDKNEFSTNDVTNFKLEMIFYSLIKYASWHNDDDRGIVKTGSIRHVYKHFGRDNMTHYLKKLADQDVIEIISIGKNQYQDGCIKIKHYQKIQDVGSYSIFSSKKSATLPPNSAAHQTETQQPTDCNNTNISQNKKAIQQKPSSKLSDTLRSNSAASACSYIEQTNKLNNGIKYMVDETDQLPPEINFYNPDSLALAHSKPAKISKSKKTPSEGKSIEVVNAYKLAYKSKYGVDPIINAATRGQACKLVDSVGKEVAPRLAQFYLSHNAQWYVRNLHKFGLLLSDAEKLHTEMQKGEYMTEALARKADKNSHEQSMLDNIQQKIDSGYFNFDED